MPTTNGATTAATTAGQCVASRAAQGGTGPVSSGPRIGGEQQRRGDLAGGDGRDDARPHPEQDQQAERDRDAERDDDQYRLLSRPAAVHRGQPDDRHHQHEQRRQQTQLPSEAGQDRGERDHPVRHPQRGDREQGAGGVGRAGRADQQHPAERTQNEDDRRHGPDERDEQRADHAERADVLHQEQHGGQVLAAQVPQPQHQQHQGERGQHGQQPVQLDPAAPRRGGSDRGGHW